MIVAWMLGCATAAGTGGLGSVNTDPVEEPPPTPPGALALEGAKLLVTGAGPSDGPLYIVDGQIAAVAPAEVTAVDVSGRFIVPAFIDSHVHFAYQPDIAEMLDGGVVAGVDLAAPLGSLSSDLSPMTVVWAGPMLTAEGGYPTQGWGRDGYGLECADTPAAAEACVDQLADAGAGVLKLPITSGPTLSTATLQAAAARAAARGLPIAAHALSDDEAALSAAIGATVLAHTPTGDLSAATLKAWSGGAVTSTLAAFGGTDSLRALREAGATVLYGTDFGNLRTTGISATELERLGDAGLSGEEILLAGTQVPAAWWGLDHLGELSAGRDASFLVLSADPRDDPSVLASPEQVWVRGQRRR